MLVRMARGGSKDAGWCWCWVYIVDHDVGGVPGSDAVSDGWF